MQKLGIKNVVLSSIFKADRNEVIDFKTVNASLGSIHSITDIITKLKNKGRYIL